MLGKLSNLPKNQRYISTITVSEIVYGAFKNNRPEYHLNNLENILLLAVNVVGFDTKAAAVCGQLRAELEQQGHPLDLADLSYLHFNGHTSKYPPVKPVALDCEPPKAVNIGPP